ncbi:hypothetical protein [Flavobacterium sp.]|uniref:hypothetical protein n=1 Tax=Flavobacterium sp. TaxID=239 RepID=UPI001217977D|nr:hypothetical protein [Flavobacterium sp.]RZJ69008.1 MAG: hypothetical protein EOO49_18865 [Flavobacterium sp.]
MKSIYLPLALFLVGCKALTSEKTGIVYAGHFEILNKTAVSDKWNKILKKHGIGTRLSIFKIAKNRDAITDEPYYYLSAESYDNSTKAATLLIRRNNYFYAGKSMEFVVCSCLEGRPMLVDKKWTCESQTEESECEETIFAAE